ncbi:MAG TPA: diguanylate cyclase [Planctomycetota bacterium]|nr:diguanylate cyclase [Planctomycetota bacterium]
MTIRVLVVDDSNTVRQALCAHLNERGIETVTARHGGEALEKLLPGHGFDVVITDLKMPGIVDGDRLIDVLKKDPLLEPLPVIVVSAFNEREAQLRNLDHGAAACFSKPWDPDVLAATVKNLARWKSREQILASDSRTDALTGLGNRRYGLERLHEEIAACVRSRRLLSVVLLDIDHFKLVNDTYGHAGGDEVLKQVSRELRGECRSTDILARWGGEEFLCIFPETDLYAATQIVDRFRQRLAGQTVSATPPWEPFIVTISGGAAEFEPGDTTESLPARADAALYKAKEEGRNRLFASQAGVLQRVVAA